MKRRSWLAIAACCCLAPVGTLLYRFRLDDLSLVPEELGVRSILFSDGRACGFGPGANESGLILYELPDDMARKILSTGIAFFRALPIKPDGPDHDWHGRYEAWLETPIVPDARWSTGEEPSNVVPDDRPGSISGYLYRYGFGIDIPADIEHDIDHAISRPGSYYAFARIGLLIVMPAIRRVAYVYSG